MVRPRSYADRARLLVLITLAVGARLCYVTSTAPDAPIASVDAWGYHRLALNLAEGHGFSLRRDVPFIPTSIRTPLYPAFLWLVRQAFGPTPRTAAIVQALLDGCTTVLTWWLTSRIAGARAGRVAALLYALSPIQVLYVGTLLTETLLSFLLICATCALVTYFQHVSHCSGTDAACAPRRTWLLASAALLGLSILCKPNAQFLPLVWAPAIMLLHRRNWRRTLIDTGLLIGTVAGVLMPWFIRNQLVFGRPFVSTAFEGNVSRISAPATLAAARGQYAIPWSSEWDGLFAELVTTASEQYGWSKPWNTLTARELDAHNHQVYLVARPILLRYPGAWLTSHLQGMARYLEPQTYRVCHARFAGRDWPPDILDDAVLHVFREIARGDWRKAGEIVSMERWNRLDSLQGTIWWSTFIGQALGLILLLCGAWRLRQETAVVTALLLTIAYLLWLPGPIAYERFLVPVTGPILALIGGIISPVVSRCQTT
jgi:4-amino-4-deoxy-L-arabinose transferase-like glycosyltransferase